MAITRQSKNVYKYHPMVSKYDPQTDEWINCGKIHNGIQKEGNSDTCVNKNEHAGHYAK